MKRQGMLSATGVLLLGLIMLMTLHEWDSGLSDQEQGPITKPAITAQKVTAKAFSEADGHLQYHLRADTLSQYDHKALTQLSQPRLEMVRKSNNWTINAQQGEVHDNGDLIVFLDQVDARNPQRQVQLNTQELRFYSDDNRIQTPGDVSVDFENGHTRAGSLSGNLDTGVLNLSKGVTSEFSAPD